SRAGARSSVFSSNHDRDRPQQEEAVAPERPTGDVEVVEAHHLLEGDRAAPEHLPEARHPRLQVEPPERPVVDVLRLLGEKRTGPAESSLISNAKSASTGASRTSASVATTRSSARFSTCARRDSRSGGKPTSGIPSTVKMSALGPTSSYRRGTMSIWTSMS